MIKCVTKIKNKTNKNNKQNGKRKMKTKISFVSSIFLVLTTKLQSEIKDINKQTENSKKTPALRSATEISFDVKFDPSLIRF